MVHITLEVSAIRQLTPDIKLFELVARDGALPPFEAGAHIDIDTGNGLRRSYSLAGDPEDLGRYVTAILREPHGGGGSQWMHDKVEAGDVLTATPPSNNFPLAENAKHHLLIAGGIGITPILAMGYRLRRIGADFHLYYCTRSPETTAFLDEVRQVFGDHATFIHDGGDVSKGIKLDRVLANPAEGTHLYVCGPSGLINATRESARHWPEGSVHYELFSSARTEAEKAEIAGRPNEAFEIVLKSTGERLTVPPDKSILEVLSEHGINVIYTCEEGWCGNCVIDLLGGKADHRDEVLTEVEKAENRKIQVCISRAQPGETLILDL
jgi:ferredoxin-NADP reductase